MKPARSHLVLAGALVVALVAGWGEGMIDGYVRKLVMDVGLAVILASSLNLINGTTGQFSLGHAGFMAVGAYTAAAVTHPQLGALGHGAGGVVQGVSFAAALMAGGLAAAVAGLLVGLPSLRLKGDYLALVTLGFGEIIRVVLQNSEGLGGALGLTRIPPYTGVAWVWCVVAVTLFVLHSLENSTYGRGFRAVHDDEVAAEAVGIDTTRYKITAFVLGAFFAGVAGGLYAHQIFTIYPATFDFSKSIELVVMVILGGMGDLLGVCLAAVLLTLLPEGLRYASDIPGLPAPVGRLFENRLLLYSAILIAVMILRPGGLFRFRGRRKGAVRA